MEEPKYILEPGTTVKIHDHTFGRTSAGLIVKQEYIDARTPSAKGIIRGIVGGHGGDVYWVQHGEDGEGKPVIAAYGWWEFELVLPENSDIEVVLAKEGGIGHSS